MSPARAALVELLEVERHAAPPPPLDELELERRRRRAELVHELTGPRDVRALVDAFYPRPPR